MNSEPRPIAQLKSKRPLAITSWLFAIAGLYILCAVNWIFGIILILIAILIDKKTFLCGACGNKVESTSKLCPACRAELRLNIRRR